MTRHQKLDANLPKQPFSFRCVSLMIFIFLGRKLQPGNLLRISCFSKRRKEVFFRRTEKINFDQVGPFGFEIYAFCPHLARI